MEVFLIIVGIVIINFVFYLLQKNKKVTICMFLQLMILPL